MNTLLKMVRKILKCRKQQTRKIVLLFSTYPISEEFTHSFIYSLNI